jgi:hypothetical protein
MTLIPNQLNLTTKQLEEQMSKNKHHGKKWKSQFDEAAAVGYDEDEKQLLITGKLKERIDTQYALRKQFLQTKYLFREVEELQKQFNDYEMMRELETTRDVIVRWYGIPMPKAILEMEFYAKEHNFKLSLTQQNLFKDRLRNVGFSKEQIDAVMEEGTIISDLKLIESMEKEYEAKKTEKAKDLADATTPEAIAEFDKEK